MSAWKDLERRVARMLGGERQFNTGAHNAEDVKHEVFAVECKQRAKIAFLEWFKQAKKNAEKSNKIPLLCVHQKHSQNIYAVLRLEDLILVMGKRQGVSIDELTDFMKTVATAKDPAEVEAAANGFWIKQNIGEHS